MYKQHDGRLMENLLHSMMNFIKKNSIEVKIDLLEKIVYRFTRRDIEIPYTARFSIEINVKRRISSDFSKSSEKQNRTIF